LGGNKGILQEFYGIGSSLNSH